LSTHLESTFQRTVDEGHLRLTRTWPGLLATGSVGGIDICLGILGLLLVYHLTHNRLLGAVAFSIGFVALTLANSELFTENFLVPVAAVVARSASVPQLLRLWSVTLGTNLVAAWLVTGLIVVGFPELQPAALSVAHHPSIQGWNWASLANAVLAGAAMTLMTWMERSTESPVAKLVVAISVAFLLVGAQMNHCVVVSVEMFAALHVGAPFGYLAWLRLLGVAALGNVAGGLGLVTLLRLVQVGRQAITQERQRDPASGRQADDEPAAQESAA
jgi:formate/nitrite transporter FocA (FNT family)